MASLNKVILIGHLTADPELKQTPNGVSTCRFSIGVSRKYTKQGEQPKSDFPQIVAWRNTAEFIAKYFKKGNAICIVGQIQTDTYEAQDGSKRYVTEVVAEEANFVEKKSDSAPAPASAPAYTAPAQQSANFEEVKDDGDLPF
jgi:single-strand DNA-binding protein